MYALQNSARYGGRFTHRPNYGMYAVYGGNFMSWLRRTGRRLFDVIRPNIRRAAPALGPALIGDKKSRDELKSIGRDTLRNVGKEAKNILQEESKRLANTIADKIRARLNRNRSQQQQQVESSMGGTTTGGSRFGGNDPLLSLNAMIDIKTKPEGSTINNPIISSQHDNITSTGYSSYTDSVMTKKRSNTQGGGGIRKALSGRLNKKYAEQHPLGIDKTNIIEPRPKDVRKAEITNATKYGGKKLNKNPSKKPSKKTGRMTAEEFINSSKSLRFI